jgi:hypothetical protein
LDISWKIASFCFSEIVVPLFLGSPEALEFDIFLRFGDASPSSRDSGLERVNHLGVCLPVALVAVFPLTIVETQKKRRWVD